MNIVTEQIEITLVKKAIQRLRMKWLPTCSREAAQEMSDGISRCKGTNIWDYTQKFDCLNGCTSPLFWRRTTLLEYI